MALFFATVPALAFILIVVFRDPRILQIQNPQFLPPPYLLAGQILSYFPLSIFMIVALPKISSTSLLNLGFRKPKRRDLNIALIGAAAMWILVEAVASLSEAITHESQKEAALELMKELHGVPEKIAFCLIAVVLAPLVEELIFRVFLFNAFSRYMPILYAIILNGFIFGAVHITGADQLWTLALPLSVGGMVLALIYAKTRCYWASVIAHAAFNAASVIPLLLLGSKSN